MDTIVAIATPPGRSAIGVIRLSGPDALPLLRTLTREQEFTPEPHRVFLKQVFAEGSQAPLDSALITYFRSPQSFTGEDMAEISCHGSPVILRKLLDCIQVLGPRLADPGEFTLRAWKNGKMNLSQAEAIRDLINAQTESAATQATRQLNGELSLALQPFKQKLVDVIVRLESALEFVEDDLPAIQGEVIKQQMVDLVGAIGSLAGTYASGHLLRDGIKVAIVGRPNVGKSSLFNKLVRLDRAIVTEVAGTTRDSITEVLSIDGIPIVLTDTAGIRVSGDRLEEFGVERTKRAMADADALVVVVDGSVELEPEDQEVLDQTNAAKRVVVVNKADLPPRMVVESFGAAQPVVHLSALTGKGLETLSAAILQLFNALGSDSVGLLVTNSRHYDLLRRAESSLVDALGEFSRNASEEIVLVGLHNALRFLGEITGETTTEDILTQIFSTFCIGK